MSDEPDLAVSCALFLIRRAPAEDIGDLHQHGCGRHRYPVHHPVAVAVVMQIALVDYRSQRYCQQDEAGDDEPGTAQPREEGAVDRKRRQQRRQRERIDLVDSRIKRHHPRGKGSKASQHDDEGGDGTGVEVRRHVGLHGGAWTKHRLWAQGARQIGRKGTRLTSLSSCEIAKLIRAWPLRSLHGLLWTRARNSGQRGQVFQNHISPPGLTQVRFQGTGRNKGSLGT